MTKLTSPNSHMTARGTLNYTNCHSQTGCKGQTSRTLWQWETKHWNLTNLNPKKHHTIGTLRFLSRQLDDGLQHHKAKIPEWYKYIGKDLKIPRDYKETIAEEAPKPPPHLEWQRKIEQMPKLLDYKEARKPEPIKKTNICNLQTPLTGTKKSKRNQQWNQKQNQYHGKHKWNNKSHWKQ